MKLAEKDHVLAVLKEVLEREKQKAKRYWRERCEELANHEDELEVKDMQISLLKAELLSTSNSDVDTSMSLTRIHAVGHLSWITQPASIIPIRETAPVHGDPQANLNGRHGKETPVEVFADEGSNMLFEEWLLSFERVAAWYGWNENDKLI